jgi:hypothetical protein
MIGTKCGDTMLPIKVGFSQRNASFILEVDRFTVLNFSRLFNRIKNCPPLHKH